MCVREEVCRYVCVREWGGMSALVNGAYKLRKTQYYIFSPDSYILSTTIIYMLKDSQQIPNKAHHHVWLYIITIRSIHSN